MPVCYTILDIYTYSNIPRKKFFFNNCQLIKVKQVRILENMKKKRGCLSSTPPSPDAQARVFILLLIYPPWYMLPATKNVLFL